MSETTSTTAPSANLPIGTSVLAFPGSRDGRAMLTRTRSNVWTLGGTPVVSVEGYAGGIALTHIEVIPTHRAETQPTTPRARECETGDNAEEAQQ